MIKNLEYFYNNQLKKMRYKSGKLITKNYKQILRIILRLSDESQLSQLINNQKAHSQIIIQLVSSFCYNIQGTIVGLQLQYLSKIFNFKIITKTVENIIKQSYQNKQLQQIQQNSAAKILCQKQINKYLSDISEGNIRPASTNCINCNEVLYLDQKLSNHMSNCPAYIGISQAQLRTKQILIRYIIGAANQSIGGILIGGMKAFSQKQLKGMVLGKTSTEELNKYIESIKNQLKTNYSNIKISYKFIRLLNTCYVKNQGKDVVQKNRYVVMIAALPINPHRLCLYLNQNQGCNQRYQICLINRIRDLQNKQRIQKTSLYYPALNFIEQHRKKAKIMQKRTNLHFKGIISCKQPIIDFKQIMNQPQQSIENQNITHTQQIDESGKKEFLKQQQPKFPFKNRSLIIVSSLKKVKYVNMLQRYLTKQKYKFELSQPYQKMFSLRGSIIFIFSYQAKMLTMRNEVEQFDRNNHITMIPIHNCMSVTLNEWNSNKQSFVEHVNKWYPNKVRYEQNKETNKCIIQSDEDNAIIFAYYWLQRRNIRPFMEKTNKY